MKVREKNGKITLGFGPEDFEETRSRRGTVWFELSLTSEQAVRMLRAMRNGVRSFHITEHGKA